MLFCFRLHHPFLTVISFGLQVLVMSCLVRFNGVRCFVRNPKLASSRCRHFSGLATFKFGSVELNLCDKHRISTGRVQCLRPESECIAFMQARPFSREGFDYYMSPEFPPIRCAEKLLETMHDSTGLPWWASLALTTIMLRTLVTLPLSIYASYITVRIERLQPELKELAKQLAGEVAMATRKFSWKQVTAKRHFKRNVSFLPLHYENSVRDQIICIIMLELVELIIK